VAAVVVAAATNERLVGTNIFERGRLNAVGLRAFCYNCLIGRPGPVRSYRQSSPNVMLLLRNSSYVARL
jgi:hypothetical protein